MSKLWLVLALLLWAFPASAQNPTCPTRPPGDSTNACASTAFVHNAAGTNYAVTSVFQFLSAAQITDVTTNACTLDVSAAINSGIATTAGRYRFPPGTYCVSTPLTICTNQTFWGDNQGSTIIEAFGSTATPLLQTCNFATLLGTNTVGGPNHFEVDDIAFNGNYPTAAGSKNNINIYGYNFILRNVSTFNASYQGIFSQWATSATVPIAGSEDGGSMEAHTYNLKAFNNQNYGIEWQGPHDSVLADTMTFINRQGGIGLATSSTYDGGVVLDTIHAYGNCNGPGIYANGTSGHNIALQGSNIQSESNGNSFTCPGEAANSFGVWIDQYAGAWFNGVITYLNAQSGVTFSNSNSKINGLVSFGNGVDGLLVAGANNIFNGIQTTNNTHDGIEVSGLGNIFSGTLSLGNTSSNYALPVPTLSFCGASPFIAGGSTDSDGVVTPGGSATTCTVTWTTSYPTAPVCTLTSGGNYTVYFNAGQPTTGGMAFVSSSSMGGSAVSYHCKLGA